MVEELTEFSAGQFETIPQLLASSDSLQMALVVLVVGLIIIVTVYRKFSQWIKTQKSSYTRPHLSRFARTAMLAFFAIFSQDLTMVSDKKSNGRTASSLVS